ncbi:MAG: heat-inducible transcriptional repressor HrcA [Caldisericia bacterium]
MITENSENRTWLVLKILISSYIKNGEPISSEEIASKMPYSVSSATIRSELARLESEGLVIRPHISSGRIPSYRGYRKYINSLLQNKSPAASEIPFEIPARHNLNSILRSASSSLSEYTQTVSIVLFPLAQRLKLKSIHLVSVPPNKVLLVMVVNADDIREFMLTIKSTPNQNILNAISSAILSSIKSNPSWTPIQIFSHLVRERTDFEAHKDIILNVLQLIREVTSREVIRILQEGAHRLFGNPSFGGSTQHVHQLLEIISVKETIQELLLDTITKGDLDIVIGSESRIPELTNAVYIGKPYQVDDAIGVLSLIGPLRMNYERSFEALNYLSKVLESALLGE